MNMLPKRISAKEARDNFTDLLGTVYYTKEAVIVEKKGRPFAVVINPEEYERFKKLAKEQLFKTIEEIQKRNARFSEKEVMQDVTKSVEEVRRERYARKKFK